MDLPDDLAQLASDWPLCHGFGLQPGDTAVVAGAYQGKVMDLLLRLYPGVTVIGFEPQVWAMLRAEERLSSAHPQARWEIYARGLASAADDHGLRAMGEYHTDAASFVNVGAGSRDQGLGRLQEITAAFTQAGVGIANLLVMNTEGYEFELIPHMLSSIAINRVEKLAIQWHLDLRPEYTEAEMTRLLLGLVDKGYELVVNDAPAWTYLTGGPVR